VTGGMKTARQSSLYSVRSQTDRRLSVTADVKIMTDCPMLGLVAIRMSRKHDVD